jgi:hypothetical protein
LRWINQKYFHLCGFGIGTGICARW